MSKKLDKLRDSVAQLCKSTEVPEPGEFLTSLMGGLDPRPRSNLLHAYVSEITDDRPSVEDWEFIRDIILGSGLYLHEPVSLDTSVKAAEKLMDFLHAKLKAIELQSDVTHQINVTPLTADEIRLFKETWESSH